MVQFSLYVHKGGLNPIHYIFISDADPTMNINQHLRTGQCELRRSAPVLLLRHCVHGSHTSWKTWKIRAVLEFPGKTQFFRLSRNSRILIKMSWKSWNSFGPWNLVFCGSLPVTSLLFILLVLCIIQVLEKLEF